MDNNSLILITRGFPFGRGEAFLGAELNTLSQNFDKIVIFAQIDCIYVNFDNSEERVTPSNVEVYRIPSFNSPSFARSLLTMLTSSLLIKEYLYLIRTKKLSLLTVKTALSYYLKAQHISRFVLSKLPTSQAGNLFMYSYWSFEEPLALVLIKNKLKAKIFSRTHGGDLYVNLQKGNYLPFRKLYQQKLDQIFTVSAFGEKYLNEGPFSSNKAILARLGTYATEFKSFEESKQLRILSIGAIYDIKRIDLMIQSISAIKGISIRWDHFGAGPDEAKIYQLAKSTFANTSIEYNFHGYITNAALTKYLMQHSFDLLLNTSSSEGVPVSMMEAMSFGIPVIGTNVGGVAEIIHDSKNGYLLPSNPFAEEVANKIEQFYQLPSTEKTKMKEAAFSTWNNKYNAEKNYQKFVEQIKA